MSRIIFVPQFPTEMRYQEFWLWKFKEEFEYRGFEVLVIGEEYINKVKERMSTIDMFSPIDVAIKLECEQVKEYLEINLKDDDILYVNDISFPGIFSQVLFHKRPKKCFAFCHATSLNNMDYFEKDRDQKFPIETATSQLFNKVFVGSKYHQEKLGWKNTVVTYLPFPPFQQYVLKTDLKQYDIISVSRVTPQKVDIALENNIEEKLYLKIFRPISKNWGQYYYYLASSKVLLITAQEDTFGYQIVDAIMNGCIPLARNAFAYPELLDRKFLYNDEKELLFKLKYIIETKHNLAPKLLCEEQMNKFYDNICNEMKG